MTCSELAHHTSGRAHTAARRTRLFTTTTAFLAIAALAALTASRAIALTDSEELTRFGGLGSGAGQLNTGAGGIATDSLTGHVFVPELNNRISEFTPWGKFVKAFGWDVAPGPVNETQEVRVRASAGQFKLEFKGQETLGLAFDAPGSESEGPGSVEAALDALSTIGGAGGSVSVEAIPGTADGQSPYVYAIAFKGSLAATDVAQLAVANGATPLAGGVPATELETRTRADGTAGGTGLESCTAESGCKKGLEGSEAGQINDPRGLAVDTVGDVYVKEDGNLRVQKFDSAGHFLWMAGGEVDEGPHHPGNLCTAAYLAEGDACGAGTLGAAPGQFGHAGGVDGIALGSGGRLFAADEERIQRFDLEGEFKAQVPVAGKTVGYLAFDPAGGNLYATYLGEGGIHKLNPITGAELAELEGQTVLATDGVGNLFADSSGTTANRIVQYDATGKPLSPPSCCATPPLPPPMDASLFQLAALGANAIGDLYVAYAYANIDAFVRLVGPAPLDFEGPPKVPPTIEGQYATSVGRDDATVGAEINPHFWSDARYYVQYGTGKCSEGGCEATKPLPPGVLLGSSAVDAAVKSAGVFLEGLAPGTTYHYRFVAVSGGGGPVRGIGGEVGVDGEESAFTTYPAQVPKTDCPNQVFRSGFSAPLPDCRAFEMVSPVDKNNGDIKTLLDPPGYPTSLEQSATDGNRFTYSSYRAFADPQAAPSTNQYMASRKDGVGWKSEAISPPQGFAAAPPGTLGEREDAYKSFSPDLCDGWLIVAAEPVLDSRAIDGYPELYRRDNCGSEGYEALIGVKPSLGPTKFLPEMQGASADGGAAIFRVKDKLTEEATSGAWQTYYEKVGGLHLVCVLPSGLPSGGNCSGGTGTGTEINRADLNRIASVDHAISTDGSRVYWTDSGTKESGPGKVYLRLNPSEKQSEVSSGECTEAEKACTVRVSETKSNKASRFLGASADGSKALFEVTEGAGAGNLYEFELGGETKLLARETLGLVGASEDLSRIYFVSKEALAGDAQAGEPNLYLGEAGAVNFIATLSGTDTTPETGEGQGLPTDTAFEPAYRAARVSPDGRTVAFISTKRLGDYDNTDQASGLADLEVYRYEVGAAGPVCVSCNPSGARPTGRRVRLSANVQSDLPTGASIPVAQTIQYFPRSLSADGNRLFFDSFDGLLPRDTNGKEDVYEWEAGNSQRDCGDRGAEVYVPSSGGCLSLISSGQSPNDSEFLDSSLSGSDVFFKTNAGLLPQDPGLIDVYDARMGGGLPEPPEPPAPCQGETCQDAAPPPNDPTPASASFRGAGNPSAARCAKGKVEHKGRCVARKHAKKHKHAKRRHRARAASHNRGTQR